MKKKHSVNAARVHMLVLVGLRCLMRNSIVHLLRVQSDELGYLPHDRSAPSSS